MTYKTKTEAEAAHKLMAEALEEAGVVFADQVK
jgi:hypothetical protein